MARRESVDRPKVAGMYGRLTAILDADMTGRAPLEPMARERLRGAAAALTAVLSDAGLDIDALIAAPVEAKRHA